MSIIDFYIIIYMIKYLFLKNLIRLLNALIMKEKICLILKLFMQRFFNHF